VGEENQLNVLLLLSWYTVSRAVEHLCDLHENRTQTARCQGGYPVHNRSVLALGLLLSWTPCAWSKDIALVSNKSTPVATITMADLVKVCKAQISHWPNGKPITLVIREPASPDAKVVVDKIYGMAPNAVSALVAGVNHEHVNRAAIVVVNTDDALVKKVESTPGAVGLVDVYSITSGVAVIKIGGKLPLEPGYPLHGN
jgi:periplasmic binding family protein